MAYDEPSLLSRTGMTQKHQIQNGMLLCHRCHGEFDMLRRYVDIVDDKMVAKVVNYSVSWNDEEYRKWAHLVRRIKGSRIDSQEYLESTLDLDNKRQIVEPNGEIALYFVRNNPAQLPNIEAAKFHKAACGAWLVALSQRKNADDDGKVPVDYRSKNIEKWIDHFDD